MDQATNNSVADQCVQLRQSCIININIQESPVDARVTRDSAVIPRWLTAPSWILSNWNSAIRSSDENPCTEPNMEWIGCTVCEIFTFKLYCDLEPGVRGHSRSSKAALFDRAHMTLYSSSLVTMPLSITVSEIQPHIGRKLLPPLVFGAVRFEQRPLATKNQNDGPIGECKNFDDAFSRFDTKHACDRQRDGQTDVRNWRGIYAPQRMCCRA